MATLLRKALIVGDLSFVFVVGAGHRNSVARAGMNAAVSSENPTPQEAAMILDQANTEGWDKAWTNLVNDVRQSFTPTLPRLEAVEVELVVGNRGAEEERLTLKVLEASGRVVASTSKTVQTKNCDQVTFVIPKGGVHVTPGQVYLLKLSGGNTFGWKYVVGGYEKGAATFNGKALLPGARSTFLFRTFGAK